jgi:hypothetical protein
VEGDVTALAERLFTRTSAQAAIDFETFISVALFSAVGLLISISIIVLDAHLPGEWF